MFFADGLVGLIVVGLWLFCLLDVITTDESRIRNLPKLAWLFIVLLLFDIGSIAWLVAGRSWESNGPKSTSKFPEYERAGRHVAQDPDDDEEFLAGVRARAESQRRQYEARRRNELDAEEQALRERPDPDDPRKS